VILSQVERILQNQKEGRFWGRKVSVLLENCGVYAVPMLNPDGIMLSQQGVFSAPEPLREELLALNGGSQDFSRWKANGRGVDIGGNFDARWEIIRGAKAPGPVGYKGTAPFSEAESQAVRDYMAAHPMGMTISYHGAGAELYWWYYQEEERLSRDVQLAKELSRITGYGLVSEERSRNSDGGLKDWYLSVYGNPGFTIEMRSPEPCPIPVEAFPQVYQENKQVILWAMDWITR
jgi:g-D-glutamyl-meso-diaminopimelate peptidase